MVHLSGLTHIRVYFPVDYPGLENSAMTIGHTINNNNNNQVCPVVTAFIAEEACF